MHLKPVHHGLGLSLLTILVALGFLPGQDPNISSSLSKTSGVNSSPSEVSDVSPEAIDEMTVDPEQSTDLEHSTDPEHSTDSPATAETASESEPQPDSLQASNSIVSIAQSEISAEEWQVVESELASFYAQKNSSAQ